MHELSVAQELVELVAEEVTREGPVRVVSIRLRIGALSGVVPSALRFAYDASTAGTTLEGSALHVEEVPAAVFCERCGVERDLATVTCLRCPACEAATPNVVRGKELEVVSVEVADLTEDVVTATAR
jgi:hydrogenase nickel incorporation protein HypA/HybF